jgi:glycosyltransferase involved in cell wall biosynthesis
MAAPLITALVDTYNQEQFIERAILSVLEQDLPEESLEILVVDDGSTDRTAEIVAKFGPRVRLLRKTNGGQASAFNFGLPQARGEYVALLDGDDWWALGKLARVIEVLKRDPSLAAVGHGVTEVYDDGSQHTEQLREASRFGLQSVQDALTFRVRKNFLGTSRFTLRADLLPRILPVPESLRFEADEYLFTLAAALGEVCILPEALTFYRIHQGNLYQIGLRHEAMARKQAVLATLAVELNRKLRELRVPSNVVKTVTAPIAAEADQLRLMLRGGYPWETVRSEFIIYGTLHKHASWAQWLLKCASLLPAMVLPPRLFYSLRGSVAASASYARLRKKLVPIPQPEHTVRTWKPNA